METLFEDFFHGIQDKYDFSRAALPLKGFCNATFSDEIDIHGLIPLLCLLGLAAWSIFLVSLQIAWRIGQVLSMKKKPNEFPSGSQHGPGNYTLFFVSFIYLLDQNGIGEQLVLILT